MRFATESAVPDRDSASYGNHYTGDRDLEGYRDGYGTFEFADGSMYKGEWQKGLRHGYGEYTVPASDLSSSTVYKG